MNAVRHSGAANVSVYLEVEPTARVDLRARPRARGSIPARLPPTGGGIIGFDRRPDGARRRIGRRAEHRRRGDRGGDVDAASRAGRGGFDVTRVFLVDDHQLFLSGVRAELGDDVDVVGRASEVDTAIEMIRDRVPDVVLVDVHMPGGGGARVIAEVLATHPDVRFLALSVSDAPGRRDRDDPRRRARLRHQDDRARRPRRRDRRGGRGRRGVLAAPRRVRARRVRRRARRLRPIPSSSSSRRASARSCG